MGNLQAIEMRNFKAFRDPFTINLAGHHLLLYGENGTGKSSIYWGLHTFLESAGKTQGELRKYFDPSHKQSLVNIDAEPLDATAASIRITVNEGADRTYEISHSEHQTANAPAISKASLASDFINYRFFFKFSNFTNREPFEIWQLFEREILPFCVTTSNENLFTAWREIVHRHAYSVKRKSRGKAANNDRAFLEEKTMAFATKLKAVIEAIATEAKDFYKHYFSEEGSSKIELELSLVTLPSYHHSGKRLEVPRILFGIMRMGENPRPIERPQTFLNEAKLTQIAISIRLAASLVTLNQSPLKLLILDDLLVSLDMSNRMKMVEIILSERFEDYQKIILTHDLGFYQETRRQIGLRRREWIFKRFERTSRETHRLKDDKSDLELAEEYLANDQLAECGNRLRKHVEANLETFLKAARERRGLEPLFSNGRFTSLGHRISEAKKLLALEGHKEFAALLQGQFSLEELGLLLSSEEIDPSKFAAATNEAKGKIIAKLKAAKPNLQKAIIELLTDASRKHLNAIELLDELENIKDRILNPASHAGVAPIYTKEAEDAVKVIRALDASLAAVFALSQP